MAIPVFQAAGTAASGIGDVTPTWPVHQADDIGLLFTQCRAQDTVAAPTGWTAVTDSPQATAGLAATSTELAVFWRRAAGAAETDPTITDPGNHVIGQILTFRGCIATGDPWDVTAGDADSLTDTAVDVPGDTTTVADCLVVAACAAATDTTTAEFSAWANADLANVTERTDVFTDAGNGGGFGVATGEKAAAGAFGATTATLATTSEQGRIMVALKSSVAGAATAFEVGQIAVGF